MDLHIMQQMYRQLIKPDTIDEVQTFNVTENFFSSVFNGQTIFSLFDHNKEHLLQMQTLV